MLKRLVVTSCLLFCCSGCFTGLRMDLNSPLCFVERGEEQLHYTVLFGSRFWLRHLEGMPRPTFTQDFSKCKNPSIVFYQAPWMKDAAITRRTEWGYEVYIRDPFSLEEQ